METITTPRRDLAEFIAESLPNVSLQFLLTKAITEVTAAGKTFGSYSTHEHVASAIVAIVNRDLAMSMYLITKRLADEGIALTEWEDRLTVRDMNHSWDSKTCRSIGLRLPLPGYLSEDGKKQSVTLWADLQVKVTLLNKNRAYLESGKYAVGSVTIVNESVHDTESIRDQYLLAFGNAEASFSKRLSVEARYESVMSDLREVLAYAKNATNEVRISTEGGYRASAAYLLRLDRIESAIKAVDEFRKQNAEYILRTSGQEG